MVNKFKKVEDEDHNAVTVTIWQSPEGPRGRLRGPFRVDHQITTEIGGQDGSWSVPQALDAAIPIAERLGTVIVIVDSDNIWQKEWGELF